MGCREADSPRTCPPAPPSGVDAQPLATAGGSNTAVMVSDDELTKVPVIGEVIEAADSADAIPIPVLESKLGGRAKDGDEGAPNEEMDALGTKERVAVAEVEPVRGGAEEVMKVGAREADAPPTPTTPTTPPAAAAAPTPPTPQTPPTPPTPRPLPTPTCRTSPLPFPSRLKLSVDAQNTLDRSGRACERGSACDAVSG